MGIHYHCIVFRPDMIRIEAHPYVNVLYSFVCIFENACHMLCFSLSLCHLGENQEWAVQNIFFGFTKRNFQIR